jgi:hypothetical protein
MYPNIGTYRLQDYNGWYVNIYHISILKLFEVITYQCLYYIHGR